MIFINLKQIFIGWLKHVMIFVVSGNINIKQAFKVIGFTHESIHGIH